MVAGEGTRARGCASLVEFHHSAQCRHGLPHHLPGDAALGVPAGRIGPGPQEDFGGLQAGLSLG